MRLERFSSSTRAERTSTFVSPQAARKKRPPVRGKTPVDKNQPEINPLVGWPALQRLLADIEAGQVDAIVVYKVDRLTRALSDFAKLVEVFDRRGVSFVSITRHFNTTTSMGRLTLNVLLSFAQFEREVIGERVRDKIAASKKKGMWMGGMPSLG